MAGCVHVLNQAGVCQNCGARAMSETVGYDPGGLEHANLPALIALGKLAYETFSGEAGVRSWGERDGAEREWWVNRAATFFIESAPQCPQSRCPIFASDTFNDWGPC